MRKIIEIVAGEKTNLLPFGIDLDKHKIVRVWTVYDEERMWTWQKYDPQTGEPVTFNDLENVPLRQHEGVFLEDYVHDWSIRQGNLFDYYSRVTERFEKVKILIEYKEMETK